MLEFDLTDVDLAENLTDAEADERAAETAQAAAQAAGAVDTKPAAGAGELLEVAPAVIGSGPADAIIWDIETGPRPWGEIEQFYTPPAPMEPWSDDMVKYGNTKDPAKRQEKYNQVRGEYEARLNSQAAEADAHKAAWLNKAALDATTGRVLAIGYMVCDQAFVIGAECSETELLRNFWQGWYERAEHDGRPMIGFNTSGFDLPFIVRRSWLLGVDVPPSAMSPDRRYWSRLFVDLMAVWNCGARDYIKLDLVARYFGHAGKNGDGGEFGRLWFCDRAQAVAYLKNDLAMTAEVARRMHVI